MFSSSYVIGGRGCSPENAGETWWSRSVPSRFGHAAILLSLTVAGCAPDRADWLGDARFTAEERAEIERGAAWLADASGTERPTFSWTYEVTGDVLPHSIRREVPTDPALMGGCAGSTIWLDADVAGAGLAGLAAHEMGHCRLHLLDDSESTGVMHRVGPQLRWTEREEGQCRASTACR